MQRRSGNSDKILQRTDTRDGERERKRERELNSLYLKGFSPLIPFTQLPKDLLYEIACMRFEPISAQLVEYLKRQPIGKLGNGGWACRQVFIIIWQRGAAGMRMRSLLGSVGML